MNEAQSQLDRLGEAVIEYANNTARQMIDEAKAQSEQLLGKTDETVLEKKAALFAKGGSADKTESSKKASRYEYEVYKKLLMHRNDIVNELFDDVIVRIADYRKKDEYKEHILGLIGKAAAEKPFDKNTVVLLSEADSDLFNEVKKRFSVDASADKNIVYGGVIVSYPADNAVIDYSFDAAIESEKRRFVSHSELSV